ncbi:MAG: HD domain-containing protein [Bacilli bacterium]|nr:HD domain-containing protein [Bacilli bacterium]
MDEIFEFYKKYNGLQNVLRKGWLMRNVPVTRQEDDAHHTLQTILLADLIIRKQNIKGVNLLKVLEMLLIHEIGEGIIGDISMIEDDYNERKKEEATAVKKQLSCLGGELSEYYFSLWQEFESRTTKDAEFAYFIDKLDAVLKAKQYDETLNQDTYYSEFYPHALEVLKENEFLGLLHH